MARLAPALLLALAACVELDAAAPGPEITSAPLTGVDGAIDQADRACHVVLRELARIGNGTGGYESAGTSWIWEGDVDVSLAAIEEGATVAISYQWGSDPTWYVVAATPSASTAPAGFARFRVRLDQHLPGPGMSGTALASARIQVMPFLRLAGGGRLFDHNRVPGDFDNYQLAWSTNGFAITRNDAVCPAAGPTPPARLVFAADGSVTQHGALVPGGQVRVEYDPARLTTCRSSRGGADLWDITAHVRWSTGEGQSSSIKVGAQLVSIPTTARAVELWFENTAVPGCQAWDSNLGRNYRFELLLPPSWVGAATFRISRDTSDPCAGPDAAGGVVFDTWARQRAAITNVCFRVWSPGVTDRDDPDLWRKLDATLRWRSRGTDEPLRTLYATIDARVGNDARYRVELRDLDPFRPYQCPSVPVTPTPDGQYVRADLEYVIVVNGVELRPAAGAYFVATFLDYPQPSCT